MTTSVNDSLGYSVQSHDNAVTVVPPAPLLPITQVESEGEPSALYFVANLSATTDSWPIASITCDFGDGNAPSATCTRSYSSPGLYRITGTVTDMGGNTASVSQLVNPRMVPVTGPKPGGTHCKTCY